MVGRKVEMLCDVAEVVCTEWHHSKECRSTTRAVPSVQFTIYHNAVNKYLAHSEIGDKDTEPQHIVEDNTADV